MVSKNNLPLSVGSVGSGVLLTVGVAAVGSGVGLYFATATDVGSGVGLYVATAADVGRVVEAVRTHGIGPNTVWSRYRCRGSRFRRLT